MSVYRPVDKVPDFPTLERKILEFWRSESIFQKIRDRNAGGKPWSYLDGPITANNPMGVHHAWGRSYKDMFQRYHAMQGRALRYQNGFDCQGLWVEVEVEKELGFESKADIAAYGIDKFVRKCKERVLTYAARQTAQSVRLGYFMDWDEPEMLLALRDAIRNDEEQVTVTLASGRRVTDDPERITAELGSPENGGSYFTFSTENNTTIWSFLKRCHSEGYVYRGHDVMPWCFRCGTGLSHAEIAEGRKITAHTSVFVRFPLSGRAEGAPRESLVAWTTTPWTLTSNVAAAVNPSLVYLRIKRGDEVLIVSKGCYERDRILELDADGAHESHKLPSVKTILGRGGDLEVLGEILGRELVGLAYEGPFDALEAQQRPAPDGGAPASTLHRVLAWDEVSDSEGTGIVHIAPGCGAEDHKLGLAHGLPAIAPLDEEGRYLDGFGPFTGQHVLEVTDAIVADLKSRDRLVAKERYPHVYPHCWRCKQELVFRLVDEWFIRMDWRERISKVVDDITWIPPDGKARENDWLKNMGDWMISKKRFYGLALPIWTCSDSNCGWFDVVGGLDELRQRATEGWDQFAGHTPHRPWIDAVKLRCGACGGAAHRVPDVGNPWLDAGIVPYSTLRYNTDRDYWSTWFPADFVVESFPGQFRNWFYALLAMSAMMTDRAPFKMLLGHALVLDARGKPMHKSTGNSIAFDEAADVFGAEIMRYLYAAQNPVQNLNFPDLPGKDAAPSGKTTLDGEVRARLLTLWNCYSFLMTYARADCWSLPAQATPHAKRSELDRWITSRLQSLVAGAHEAFEGAALYRFIQKLEAFTEDLSNWWLRRSRRRFWGSDETPDKSAAFETLYEVLETLTRLLAPVTPFLAEEMHQNLVRVARPGAALSVHLEAYPIVDETLRDEALEKRIGRLIELNTLALSLRALAKVRARQPLAALIVRPRDAEERAILEDTDLVAQILEECNLKALRLVESTEGYAKAEIKADFKALGPRFGHRMQAVARAITALDPAAAAAALSAGSLTVAVDGELIVLQASELAVRWIGAAGLVVGTADGTFAALDTVITPELECEGIARDFNRLAQDQRRDAGFSVSDRIAVTFSGSDRIHEAVSAHSDWLCGELLADRIERVEAASGTEGKVGGESVSVSVTRLG